MSWTNEDVDHQDNVKNVLCSSETYVNTVVTSVIK